MVLQIARRRVSASLRRKISISYVSLYIMITIIISAMILFGSMLIYINDDNEKLLTYITLAVEDYYEGVYDEEMLFSRVETISKLADCGIYFELEAYSYVSEIYGEVIEEGNRLRRVRYYQHQHLYPQSGQVSFEDQQGVIHNVTILMIRPVEQYSARLEVLLYLLIACLIFGAIMMWYFGIMNNKVILSPLFKMTKEAEEISINNLSKRLNISDTKYELKDLAITLNEMLDRLNDDYEKQKRFVSDVSHELRTPISIITGYTNMLKRWGKDDEEILNESIDAIISESDNMKILVDNLLTLVRSDNQTLKYNRERFFINEMVEEVVRETRMINNKNHEIISKVHDAILVNMDPQMIKQAIRIFVDNAVKYTDENGHIEVNCIKEVNHVRIQIIDNGIGMSPEDVEHVFDRFYRSDESRTRETGGHGLGLSIAKVIIIGHNGRIKVKSKMGEGSEFNITFPL